jgi:hypothetical protein
VAANRILTVREPPVLTALGRVEAGTFRLSLKGGRGFPYTVDYSSNLTHRRSLTNFTATNVITTVHDPNAAPAPSRFYRAWGETELRNVCIHSLKTRCREAVTGEARTAESASARPSDATRGQGCPRSGAPQRCLVSLSLQFSSVCSPLLSLPPPPFRPWKLLWRRGCIATALPPSPNGNADDRAVRVATDAQGNIVVTGYSAAWVDGQLFSQGMVFIKYSGSPRLPSPRGYLGCFKSYSPNSNGVAANAAGVLWSARIMAVRIIRTNFPSIPYTSQVEAAESLLGMTRRRQGSRVKSQLRRSRLKPGNQHDSLAASATEDENQSRVSFDDTS